MRHSSIATGPHSHPRLWGLFFGELMSVKDFENQLKTAYRDEIVIGVPEFCRFSSGIFSLDKALGGGWTHGMFHLLVGPESSGKTTLAMKAAASINSINKETGKFDLSMANPCCVFYADQEGTLDPVWAHKQGFNTRLDGVNLVAGLTSGEQLADTVNGAIESGEFSLIIIDSLETTVATKTLENSNEDSDVGGRSRILNRAYRQWACSVKKIRNQFYDRPWRVPTILAINQIRLGIGVMQGDPRVLPGGRAQLHYSSTITWMGTPTIKDDDKKEYGMGEFKGLTRKNKTGVPPKQNFQFLMALLDLDELPAGGVANYESVFRAIKDLELLKKTESGYEFNGDAYRVQGDLKNRLCTDPEYLHETWKFLMGTYYK